MTKTGIKVDDHVYREILDAVPEATILADRAGLILVWTPAAETIFGFTAEEAVGQSLDLIVPESMRQAHWDGYDLAMKHGAMRHTGGSMITRSLHKSGQRLYIDVSFAIVKDQSGALIGAAAIARDATERYLREKSQQQAAAAGQPVTATHQPQTADRKSLQSYSATGITVNFDPNLCYHSAVCLKTLPAVFDVHRKRWIKPELGAVDEVIATVLKCPSGALTYIREGHVEATADAENPMAGTTVQACLHGPLHVEGDFKLFDEYGREIVMPGRAALCRCGGTGNQPFCDNTHQRLGFRSQKR